MIMDVGRERGSLYQEVVDLIGFAAYNFFTNFCRGGRGCLGGR